MGTIVEKWFLGFLLEWFCVLIKIQKCALGKKCIEIKSDMDFVKSDGILIIELGLLGGSEFLIEHLIESASRTKFLI